MDFERMADDLGFEREEFMEILNLFVCSVRGELQKVEQALSAADHPTAERAAHTIKGSAGNLGFMDLFTMARQLEDKIKGGLVSEAKSICDELMRAVDRIAVAAANC